ncbi:TMV resistance protein N [Cajanus cajan]|uniref:TMV resistance protein N n=1 Tax=Cajanus cajan TaxID=3821 RepID=UPI00098DBBC9|nr:TMV resistance protein N [Cajanus cajan]
MECLEERGGRLFWPVFYGVDPSQVRTQSGSYAEALENHENDDKVMKWREALSRAANMAAWHFQHGLTKLAISIGISNMGKNCLVGLESLVLQVTSLLGQGSEEGVFESLSSLDFEGCKFLTELPSLSGIPNLTAVSLNNCTDLIRIHSSVGFLDKLKLLSAQGCTQLEILVPCIYLTSLETLDLRDCSRLRRFPEVLRMMENIREVYLDHTNIDELPFSIGNFVGLRQLFLRDCQRLNQLPSTIHILPQLEIVTAYGCGCRGYRFRLPEEEVEKVAMWLEISNLCFLGTFIGR